MTRAFHHSNKTSQSTRFFQVIKLSVNGPLFINVFQTILSKNFSFFQDL